jgi:hypothetical protein
MRISLIALCLVLAGTLARADTPTVKFDGQRYHLDFQHQAKQENGEQGDGLAEFTLDGETVNNWTKLFAYYLFPDSGDDPVAMVEAVGKAVKEANPDANYALYEGNNANAAIIDFLTWTPGSDGFEFNVFKYAPAEYGPGLVALQFAKRFKYGELDVEGLRALRKRAVEEMAQADIGQARRYFEARAKEQSASADRQDVEQGTAAAGATP